ncbi:hypothetical protein GCM10028791_40890 [Echinicola sediminis]
METNLVAELVEALNGRNEAIPFIEYETATSSFRRIRSDGFQSIRYTLGYSFVVPSPRIAIGMRDDLS